MKKELFYIRGNAERADEVKAMLRDNYHGQIDYYSKRDIMNGLLYTILYGKLQSCYDDSIFGKLLQEYGTELHLPEINKQEFKVGDVVVQKDSVLSLVRIVSGTISDNVHVLRGVVNTSDTYRLATKREINVWNEVTLHPKGLHYSKADRRIKYWFLPFEQVLVRDKDDQRWNCEIFSNYNDKKYTEDTFECVGNSWKQCIPYNEKTAHLIGTTDAYEEEEL